MTKESTSYKIPYFSNKLDISKADDPKITRAIIVLHGSNRTAGKQYNYIKEVAQSETDRLDTLLLISPQFLIEEDIISYNLDDQHLYWSGSGWRIGYTSRDLPSNPRSDRFSAFEVMDSILLKLTEYPNIRKIVLSGHSAGGQFVNRYSASSPIPDVLSQKNIDLSFVVNNPASYVYLDEKRKVLGTQNIYKKPPASLISKCRDYNEYKYGLDDLPYYLRNIGGAEVVRQRLQTRKVTYLIGQIDNDPTLESFDDSCEAQFQGIDRFERALNYFDYLVDYYGPTIYETQQIHIVPGVGHSSLGMLQSTRGRESVFRN